MCCAGSRLLVQENIHDEVVDRLKTRLSTLRLGDPLDKNTDIGAINSAEQLERIRELSDIGEAEGAERWSPDCEIPENGFWFAPTIFDQRVDQPPDRPRGDLRTGAVGADVPHAGRGHRQGEQHARTACRPASGATRAAASSRSPTSCVPAWSGRTPSTASTRRQPVRRLQGVGLRPRGRSPRPRRVPEAGSLRVGHESRRCSDSTASTKGAKK